MCPSSAGLRPRYELDTSVLVIDLFPGLSESNLRYLLSTPGIRGIVLRTYGAGNGPTAPWFVNLIRETVERGVIILNVTQCVNGGVHTNRYVAGDLLAGTGVISGHDITFEAAITKMMFLFGLGIDKSEVKRLLGESLAGEVTLPDCPA